MKRNITHIITVFFTICVLIRNLYSVTETEYLIWYVLSISANVITIFLLIKNLDTPPKKINDSWRMFAAAVLSTNISVFVSLGGGFGKYSDILILKQIGTLADLLTMPWYIYSLISLGKGVLPEANGLRVTKAYKWSRHPLYLTYMVWIAAQNLIYQSASVLAISVVQVILLLIRARNEEKILAESFPIYEKYKNEVCWLGRKKMNKKYNASFTLEAAVVMSSIIMILFAVLYAFMIMYQNVIVTYAASYAAQQGAVTWVNSGLNINDGTGDYNSELYYRIAEFANTNKVKAKKQKIEECVKEKLKGGILSADNCEIKVDFKNYVFQRQIHVEIKQEIPIPFSGIVKYFNNGQGFAISTKAVAAVPEPTEYIRNVDYAVETATTLIKFIDKKLGISNGFEKFKSAIKELK